MRLIRDYAPGDDRDAALVGLEDWPQPKSVRDARAQELERDRGRAAGAGAGASAPRLDALRRDAALWSARVFNGTRVGRPSSRPALNCWRWATKRCWATARVERA